MLNKWSLSLLNLSYSYGKKVSLKVNITSLEENRGKYRQPLRIDVVERNSCIGWGALNSNVVMLGLWPPTKCFHSCPVNLSKKQQIEGMIVKPFLNLHYSTKCGFENRNKVTDSVCGVVISILITFTQ